MERAIFKATNSRGVSYDFSDLHQVGLFSQTGLGFDKEITSWRVNNQWVISQNYMAQKEITGTLLFVGSDSYRQYFDFIKWTSYTPIVLSMQTEVGTFYIDTVISSVVKEEANHNTTGMTCDVTFLGLGLWYTKISKTLVESFDDNVNVYDYTYDFLYGQEAINYLRFESNSASEAPTTITIYGRAVRPSWAQYVNGELVATGAYNGTIDEGAKLVVSNIGVPFSIDEYTLDDIYVANRYQDCDFSTDRFISLQTGNNMITFSHSNADPITVRIDTRMMYESV